MKNINNEFYKAALLESFKLILVMVIYSIAAVLKTTSYSKINWMIS